MDNPGQAQTRRAVSAAVIGNVLEWYDFAVYAYVAVYIATTPYSRMEFCGFASTGCRTLSRRRATIAPFEEAGGGAPSTSTGLPSLPFGRMRSARSAFVSSAGSSVPIATMSSSPNVARKSHRAAVAPSLTAVHSVKRPPVARALRAITGPAFGGPSTSQKRPAAMATAR